MTAQNKVTVPELNAFLGEHSTDNKFFIEYGGFLSNHLSHAAIALQYLGDGQEHFKRYLLDHYAMKLEPMDGDSKQKQDGRERGDGSLHQLVGKRTAYYELLKHYKDLLEKKHDGSVEALLRECFPPLSAGLICAAFHPLIHMGYALSVGNKELVVEGLAYLHHSHRPPIYSTGKRPDLSGFGKGDRDILEVLASLRDDEALIEHGVEKGKHYEVEEAPVRGFQCNAMALLEKGDLFAEHVLSIKTPPELATPSDLASWVLDQIIVVFQASEKTNDFFLLHGVTSAWALKQIVPHLEDTAALEAIFYHVTALLVAYVVLKCPKLDLSRLEDTKEVSETSWDQIISQALAMPDDDVDEHVFKLIQVCLNQSRVSSAPGMEAVCKRASLTSMSKPFFTGVARHPKK